MCGLEFPDLQEQLWLPYQDQGLRVVGIAQGGLGGGDTHAIVESFVAQTGVTFPIGWDTTNSYAAFPKPPDQSISPFPLDVVIDRQGRIAYLSREYDAEALRAVVEKLLSE